MTVRRLPLLWLSLSLIGGCATYRPLPLTPGSANAALGVPRLSQLEVSAARIHHPLLHPVAFSGGLLTPDQIAVIADVANPDLRAARDQMGVARAQLIAAGVLPNPTLSLGLSLPFGNLAGLSQGYSAGLGWSLRALLLRNAQIGEARAHVRSVALGIAWKEWQVAEGAKLDALRIIELRRAIKAATRIRDQAVAELSVMRRALTVHDVTIIDEAAAEAAAQKARVALLTLEAEASKERMLLNQALGLPPQTQVPLVTRLGPGQWRKLPSLARVTQGLQERRLDLVALRFGYESQEQVLRAQVLMQFPGISLNLTRARDTTDVNTINPGATIELPIFNRNQGGIASARATRTQLFDEYRARLFAARAQAAQILGDMAWLKRRIHRTREQVAAARTLQKAAAAGFRNGDINAITYYQVRRQLATAELGLYSLQRQLGDLGVALEIASGRYFEEPQK